MYTWRDPNASEMRKKRRVDICRVFISEYDLKIYIMHAILYFIAILIILNILQLIGTQIYKLSVPIKKYFIPSIFSDDPRKIIILH